MKYNCPVCNVEFHDKEEFMKHLTVQHPQNLRQVLSRERTNECPRCKARFRPEALNPSSICGCGYPIGKWAFRRIAGAWALIYGRER